ncbi:MAG TPA: class I SAM-dependent methyltransferase [Acidimicrobiales bacterium]|nr:class I SAM-dependent methyltransferase [Acidimicrobiales bacterium]
MSVQEQTDPSEVRGRVRAMWASVAEEWGQHADEGDARVARVTERMLAGTDPRPGERVLELAAGAGGLGLAVAALVGRDGEVVVSDAVAEMVAIAARRADERGLDNVCTAMLDVEAIDEPDRSFDVVLCREGMMFALDPAAAAREIARVTRPGGRVAVSVWGPPAQNPWLGLAAAALSAELGRQVPPPGGPGPFALADAVRLRALFVDAGLEDIAIEEVTCPLRAPSFEAWWARTSTIGGPLVRVIAGLSDDVRAAVVSRLREEVRRFRTPEGVELPGLVLLLSARRPS